jgi:hypothetical protein
MSRHARLEIIGPAVLFAALLGAEIAAYALAFWPSSPTLWSLNAGLFGMFRAGHYLLSSRIDVAYSQLLCIGGPLFVTACYGFIRKRRLALALASSLAFIYVVVLACAWCLGGHAWQERPFIVAGLPLLGASLLSCLASHITYLRACRAEVDVIERLCFRAGSDRDRRRPVLRGAQ